MFVTNAEKIFSTNPNLLLKLTKSIIGLGQIGTGQRNCKIKQESAIASHWRKWIPPKMCYKNIKKKHE